jgi:hypothetical protein
MHHEYAFDVKLFAVVRVKASSEREARAAYKEAIDCVNADDFRWGTIKTSSGAEVRVTEMSLDEPTNDELFEVDGDEVPPR